MIKELLCTGILATNMAGLFLTMNGMECLKSLFKRQEENLHGLLYFISLIVVSRVVAEWLGNAWSLVFVVEYAGILCMKIHQGQKIYSAALKGICCILGVLVAELVIIAICYHQGITYGDQIFAVCNELREMCGLGAALMQFFLNLVWEMKKVTGRFQKTLMVTLGVKVLEDTTWMYVCIWMSVFAVQYQLMIGLFLLSILVDYIVLFILRVKIENASEQQKRADIHMNTYEYYLNMEEEHLQIRKMYHEMKNQMMIMGTTEQDPDTVPFGHSTLAANLQKIDKFYHTGQSALDILLFDTRLRAQSRNIEFEAVISEGCLDFMKEEDINIIFSNAMINAIEACEKIQDGPKRITVKAGENADDTLIYIQNTVSRDREKGSLNTSKKNKIVHGIGMSSIQECVEKYHGYMSIIEEEESFQLAILFSKE